MCRKRKVTDYHNAPRNAASRWLLAAVKLRFAINDRVS